MTNTRWFKTDYVEEKCEEFVLLSEHKPEKAVRKIWPLLVWFLPVCSLERSFTEAKTFFERALKLLKRQAPGLERTERQAVLLTGLGGVIMATQGWGASEAEGAYSQAWALRQSLGETPKLFSALWGLWLFYWGRGSFDIASEAVADLLVRGRRAEDSALLLQAHHAAWATAFSRGDLEATMQHTEEGLRLYEADKHAGTASDFGNHDAGVCCRLFRARALVLLGRTDEATRACNDAIDYPRISLIHSQRLWHSCSPRASIRCCVIRWRRKHTRPPRLQSHANRDSSLCWLGRRRSKDGPKRRTE